MRTLHRHEAVQTRPRQRGVEEDPALHEPRSIGPVFVQRKEERQPAHEVRRDDVHQQAALVMRLAHEADVAETQIAQSAVDQLRRGARRRACEVPLVDERNRQTVCARCLRDARTDDAAADDQQVEVARRQLFDRSYAIHKAFVQARLPAASATSSRPYGVLHGFSSRHAVISPAESRSMISELFG